MAKLKIVEFEIGDEALASSVAMIAAAFGNVNAAAPVAAVDAPPSLSGSAALQPNRALPSVSRSNHSDSEEREAPRRGRPAKAALPPPATKELRAPKKDPAAPSPGVREDSFGARILEQLGRKAMSSVELTHALKLEPNQVYQGCNALKNKNLIVGRNDDAGDGTRRWYLVKP